MSPKPVFTAHINQFGEIVWPKQHHPKVFFDWNQMARISEPFDLDAVLNIQELARKLGITIEDNARLGLSIEKPHALVRYFLIKRLEMSGAETCDDLELKGLKTKPSAFIKAGVRYAVHAKCCFIADPERESRKMVAAIAVQQVLGFPCLWIGQQKDIESWQEIFTRLLEVSIPMYRLGTQPEKLPERFILFVDVHELRTSSLPPRSFWAAIVDHAEMFKNPSAERTQLVKNWVDSSNYIFLLTDFPVNLQVSDLVEPLDIIGKTDEFQDLIGFMRSSPRDTAPTLQAIMRKDSDQVRLKNIYTQLRLTCMVRRGQDPGLKFQELVESISTASALPEGVAPEEIKSPLHRLGLLKVPFAVEWLKKYLEEHNEKIAVFVHHNRVGAFVAEKLSADFIYGDLKSSLARDAMIDKFLNSQEVRVLVIAKDAEIERRIPGIQTAVFVEPILTPERLSHLASWFQEETDPHKLKFIYLCANSFLDTSALYRIHIRLERVATTLDEGRER